MLKVEGEQCYRVLPLDYPPDGSEQTANAMLRYPAAQLFVQRVSARDGTFVLTDEEAPFVAEMCRKLDGLPLAIELAAGQAAAFGIKNTVARLASRLELLKLRTPSDAGDHGVSPTEQNMRTVVDQFAESLQTNATNPPAAAGVPLHYLAKSLAKLLETARRELDQRS